MYLGKSFSIFSISLCVYVCHCIRFLSPTFMMYFIFVHREKSVHRLHEWSFAARDEDGQTVRQTEGCKAHMDVCETRNISYEEDYERGKSS